VMMTARLLNRVKVQVGIQNSSPDHRNYGGNSKKLISSLSAAAISFMWRVPVSSPLSQTSNLTSKAWKIPSSKTYKSHYFNIL
jgi:hypothetical protein